jgi:hypothetical protein
MLYRLLPRPEVHQETNATRSFVTSEGLTQESYLLHENSSGDNTDDDEEDNPFVSSLLVDDSLSSLSTPSARDILKPQINEVLQCLDTLKSRTSIQRATKLLDDLANELRLELAKLTGSKRNIDGCRTVNLNVEENAFRKSRTYASRNC